MQHEPELSEGHMSELILTSTPNPGVGLVKLNQPPMNIGHPELFAALERALTELARAEARVVVISSNVPGYFLAHGSLDRIVALLHEGREIGDSQAQLRVMRMLDRGDMVSIAAVDGQAWGGGAELLWACDLRVVSPAASIAQPEVNVGVTPGWGGAAKIARLAGEAAALRMLLDGRPVGGEEAYRLGLAQRLATHQSAEAEALEWAAWLAARPPWALKANKSLIKAQRDLPLKDALPLEVSTFVENASRPETAELMRRVSERYANGANSYVAFGIDGDAPLT
jgi:enoyl-CoA hydratase/carnithine racemase